MTEQTEIATIEPGAREVAVQNSGDMLAAIMRAAYDPNVDAQKVVALAGLAMQLKDREQVEQFNRDKTAAIIAMPVIRRDGKIIIPGKNGEADRVQGRFAKYESLQAVCDPILAAHNLVLTHNVDSNGQMMTVQPILSHTNGYVEKGGAMPLPLDTSGGKNNTQGAGSSLSYGMRYTYCAMVHIRIHGIDDDGNLGETASGDPRDRWSTEQRELVTDGMSAAAKGVEPYEAWFRALSPAERGWLAFEGQHDQLKAAAANSRRK